MTLKSADAFIAVLDSWVGTVEDPPHSNRTFIGAEFGYNGVAWCAETMSVAQDRVGLHCFHTASVADAIHLCKAGQHSMTWVPRDGTIRKGDMPTFDWKGHGNPSDMHISAARDPGTQAKFQTVGGNEQDSVMVQWRDRTYVQGFIRLPWSTAGPITPTEDEEMPYLIAYKRATPTDRPAQYVVIADRIYGVGKDSAADLTMDGAKTFHVEVDVYDKLVQKAE